MTTRQLWRWTRRHEQRARRFPAVVTALIAGAAFAGFVAMQRTPTGASHAWLAAAIVALHSGLSVLDPSSLESVTAPKPVVNASAPSVSMSRTAENSTLTRRENEVLVLLAEGLSNKEIAAKLSISEHTAKFHVTAVMDKVDARNRADAVAIILREGLIAL